MKAIIINTQREGYSPEQVSNTVSVGELKELLEQFDEEDYIYLSFDNGYTFGGITQWQINEEYFDWEDEQ